MSEEHNTASIEDSFRVAGEEMIHFVTSTVGAVLPSSWGNSREVGENTYCGPSVERVDRERPNLHTPQQSH